MYVCPSDGHATDPEHLDGPICVEHGVPLFTHCPDCHQPWPLVAKGGMFGDPDWGADFCGTCAMPAPWLTREQLLRWIQDQVKASGMSGELPRSTALEIAEMVKRLEPMSADDTRTIEAWRSIRDKAPRVWAALRPVINTVVGEAVKKALGL